VTAIGGEDVGGVLATLDGEAASGVAVDPALHPARMLEARAAATMPGKRQLRCDIEVLPQK
jgi:hypothetical protein